MEPVNFGIDLGTTNSLIAKFDKGKITIFKNPIGHKESLASVVAFRPDRILIGDKAKEYLTKDALNVFGSFKRKMGTDEKYYVVNIDDNVTPVALSTHILKELKNFIHTQEIPEAAVITIPASFDNMQSNATLQAGKNAGFKDVFLLQEPIAASLAYFNRAGVDMPSGHWLVYDLGGGTFDAALVRATASDLNIIDHEGNNFLGGVDFDFAIIEKVIVPYIEEKIKTEHFLKQLTETYGPYEKLYHQLLFKAEEAKKELSGYEHTIIECEFEYNGQLTECTIPITQQQLHDILRPRIDDTIKMIRDILTRNNLTEDSIEQIILVGGSTYIPFVREHLNTILNIRINTDIDPTTAIVAGAAYYAANKYYEPAPVAELSDIQLDDLLSEEEISVSRNTYKPTFDVDIAYSKSSKEDEELLLFRVQGQFEDVQYRITRSDGGYDTGIMKLKPKFTEFVPLLPNTNNTFQVRFYDNGHNEITALMRELTISHGQYSINGQPIPKDICIEVDDKDNNTTKLEVIFEKNSILPQKKMLYREISKTIKKGDPDSVIINILEGDRNANPSSNLPIGYIEISGKDLTSDLLKGSDIEIQITMDESRTLSAEVFLVMTNQEYKQKFSFSEKSINVSRLREQFVNLEQEIRAHVKQFNIDSNDVWAIQSHELLKELLEHKPDILSLKDNDKSDKKYIIAEAVNKISQSFDRIGGNDRLEHLRIAYMEAKEFVEKNLPLADFDRDKLAGKYNKITAGEDFILRTKNASVLQNAIDRLNDLGWDIMYNNTGFLIRKFQELKHTDPKEFSNYRTAQSMFKMAEKALDAEKYHEFRQTIYNIYSLFPYTEGHLNNKDFKGTGIG